MAETGQQRATGSATDEFAPTHAGDADKLIIFISYSKSDMVFADRLVEALEANGFGTRIDRRNLEYGEKWQGMLREFIAEADTVVFVVSPRSVASQWCKWEVAQVAALSKRLVPIVLEPAPQEALPPEIADWQLMPFEADGDFNAQVATLAAVLLTDRDWVKEHTRLAGLAATWDREQRRPDALIQGRPLAAVEAWKSKPRKLNLKPSALVEAFISESRAEETRRTRRNTRIAWSVAAGALVLAGLAVWQSIVAGRERDRAELELENARIAQSRFLLDRARERLDKKPEVSMLLMLEALPDETAPSRRKWPVIDGAHTALDRAWRVTPSSIVLGHDGAVSAAAFSPDATKVVTASEDRTARVWDVATGREIAVFKGHCPPSIDYWFGCAVNSAAFSPDGAKVVTASNDKTARVWDAATGLEVAVLKGHCPPGVDSVNPGINGVDGTFGCHVTSAFSPDGERVVTASQDKTARVWDATTGREIAVLRGHEDAVLSAAFSPEGERVVTASQDKTARIWNAAGGREIAVLKGHEERVDGAAFSPDGTKVVTASFDKTARVWDAATGLEVAVLKGHGEIVQSAAFSPDGRRVVTASNDTTARVWDAATGSEIAVLKGHEDWVGSAAFSPDGQRVLTRSGDKTARVWDAATGQEIAVLKGHGEIVQSAAFSPDGQRVVTASADKTARVWHAATGRVIAALMENADAVLGAEFNSDGTSVVTASSDKTARVWNAATGREIVALMGHCPPSIDYGRLGCAVKSAAFSPDGQRVVTGSDDKTARVWDAATGREIAVLKGHEDLVRSAAFSPDGQRIVTASNDKTARIWNAATGREIAGLKGHCPPGVDYGTLGCFVMSAAFGPDGTKVVTASSDRTARVWDAATGREIAVLKGHENWVLSAAFSPNGQRVVTASLDKTARVWDAATGREIASLRGHCPPGADYGMLECTVRSAAFSPDGRQVVTASWDKTARLWDAATGQEIAVLKGHQNWVNSAAFSPDGAKVVTASNDKTARVWDAATGEEISLLTGHGDQVNSAAFSPDGQRVVTASGDKTARIWYVFSSPKLQALVDRAKTDAPRCLTLKEREDFFLSEEAPNWCHEMGKWPYNPRR